MDVSEERRPVTKATDLATLDDAEILDGYLDGLEGFPCGANRSRSYWHGWGNGMRDKGRLPMDAEARALAKDILAP